MTDLPYPAAAGGSSAGDGWTPKLVLSTLFMALVLEALGLGATMISIGLPSVLKTFPTAQVPGGPARAGSPWSAATDLAAGVVPPAERSGRLIRWPESPSA
jgi:hypothetical protein